MRILKPILIVLVTATAAHPCGDKLLSLGHLRAARAFKAGRPANVLIFQSPDHSPIPLRAEKDFVDFLHQAGHRVTVAYTPSELEKIIGLRSVDVLLLDTRDIEAVQGLLTPLSTKPSVVALLYKPSKASLAASEQRYRWAVALPVKPGPLLATIDSAALSKLSQDTRSARN